jgi:hypothetical protein
VFRHKTKIKTATNEKWRRHAGNNRNPIPFFEEQQREMGSTAGAEKEIGIVKIWMGPPLARQEKQNKLPECL